MSRKTAVSLFIVCAWAAPIVAGSFASDPTAYDRAAERAVTGTITGVAAFPGADGAVGVHLDLKTAEGVISIHVAPAEYMGRNNFSFYADEQVAIIGAATLFEGNRALWARAIQKGSAMLVLRNADGTPKWTPATDGVDGCGVTHAGLPRGTER
jgi:hypothetical protein